MPKIIGMNYSLFIVKGKKNYVTVKFSTFVTRNKILIKFYSVLQNRKIFK